MRGGEVHLSNEVLTAAMNFRNFRSSDTTRSLAAMSNSGERKGCNSSSPASRTNKLRVLFVNSWPEDHIEYTWHFTEEALRSIPDVDLARLSPQVLDYHLSPAMLWACFRFVRTLLTRAKDTDIVLTFGNSPATTLLGVLKRLKLLGKYKVAVVEFGVDVSKHGSLRSYLRDRFIKLFYSSFDAIFFLSQHELTYYRHRFFDKQPPDLGYIPFGPGDEKVNQLEKIASLADYPPLEGEYVFSVGKSGRDYETLLAAAQAFPETRFVIMARETFKELPPNVSLAEWGSYDDYITYLKGSRFTVIPLYKEDAGCGLRTLFEAWALSRPAIAANTEVMAEYVQAKSHVALTYAPEDVESLKTVLSYALNNRGEIESIGRDARAHLSRMHSSKAYLDRLYSRLHRYLASGLR